MVKLFVLWCPKCLATFRQAVNKSWGDMCVFTYQMLHSKETEKAQISYSVRRVIALKDDMQFVFVDMIAIFLLYEFFFAQ